MKVISKIEYPNGVNALYTDMGSIRVGTLLVCDHNSEFRQLIPPNYFTSLDIPRPKIASELFCMRIKSIK